jgi:pimeloyl-ACP methyl ester carboxylesterase
MKSQFLGLLVSISLLFTFTTLFSQQQVELVTQNGSLFGTLLVSEASEKRPVVLIIAGSGPTDRDGNQVFMNNNSLKYLAEGLSDMGVASLRYDKRGIGASRLAGGKEEEFTIDVFIDDAVLWIKTLQADSSFSSVFVAGHSEGSLIGMVACNKIQGVSGLISIAGAGRSADLILKEQLASQPDIIKDYSYGIIDRLKSADTVSNISPLLMSLFRPSVQPYLISWFKYDPASEVAKISVPTLILQGTTDIQVSVSDANLLKEASPSAELAILEGMDHILKASKNADSNEQFKNSYANPDTRIMLEPVTKIVDFIKRVNANKP